MHVRAGSRRRRHRQGRYTKKGEGDAKEADVGMLYQRCIKCVHRCDVLQFALYLDHNSTLHMIRLSTLQTCMRAQAVGVADIDKEETKKGVRRRRGRGQRKHVVPTMFEVRASL